MPNPKHSIEWELSIGGAGADDEENFIKVTFEGEIEPHVPMIAPDLNQPGEPAEGGFAELISATYYEGKSETCPANQVDEINVSWMLAILPESELTAIAERLYEDWNEAQFP